MLITAIDAELRLWFRSDEGRLSGVVLPLCSRNRLSAFRPKRSYAEHAEYVRYGLLAGRSSISNAVAEYQYAILNRSYGGGETEGRALPCLR